MTADMTAAPMVPIPTKVHGLAGRVKAAIEQVLRAELLAPLEGDFHEKFLAMWNAPGNREAAAALRACVRSLCEQAAQHVLATLDTQLGVLLSATAVPPSGTSVPADFLRSVGEQVLAIEGELDRLEGSY